MGYLDKIKTPSDIKSLSKKEIEELSGEIREEIIDTVSKNGGHLASNLGVVELTIALHRVFDLPNDSIIFDVGHQSYVHKLLTGRKDKFNTLRKKDGISGFTNRFESEYDAFGAGHSGTSISAALGIAAANKLKGNDAYSIAVVGDGSLTNGMIYEALNNCCAQKWNVIIVINDNEMSISKNVGAMSSYLSEVSNSRGYLKFKNRVYTFCFKTGLFGKVFLNIGRFIKNIIKKILTNKNYFECLGLKYYGPIDGHDQELLELVFNQAKKTKGPCVVHVMTQKGKGYLPAEQRADSFHSVGSFDRETGKTGGAKYDFSSAFGDALTDLAENDGEIVAVTAAMAHGTGLDKFSEKFKDRFFDVGIAEEHAVTFCAGLASTGKKPVFAVYSSFFQRCYDQLIHDVAIQKLPVIFAVDRAGLVSGDGITHQGIYDCSFLLGIPGVEVYSPETYDELRVVLYKCLNGNCPSVIRYPKGVENKYESGVFERKGYTYYTKIGHGSQKVALITYGKVTYNVYTAAKNLCEKFDCSIMLIKLLRIKPIDYDQVFELCRGIDKIIFIEEGILNGGAGENLAYEFSLRQKTVNVHSIDQSLNFSGNADDLYEKFGFTPNKIEEWIIDTI